MAHIYMFQIGQAAQDSQNCFCCLEAFFLQKKARTTLYAEHEKYTLRRGTVAATPEGQNV